MNIHALLKARNKTLPLRGLSIQQRLPLLIFVLLLCIVVALGWLSQIGVKRAALEIGKERLGSLTGQLSSLFAQSAVMAVTATHAAAGHPSVKNFLCANSLKPDSAMEVLDKLRPDSTWILAELFDVNYELVLRSARTGTTTGLNSRGALVAAMLAPDSCSVGRFCRIRDSVYFSVVAAVSEKKAIIGYLVRWRRQLATQKALAQFSQLLGTNATLYLANRDGTLWTDMIRPVAAPPVQINTDHPFFEYPRAGNNMVIASSATVANTPWTMLIEFSEGIMLETSRRFFHWIMSIGAVIVLIGILLAWLISRNITRPLNQLTAATAAMAAGDYTITVEMDRRDELGKLARAFNAMKFKVKNAQDNLEKKVLERTNQLNAVNKELEAFSYSVSHDLRAPLRYISGYASILKEDHAIHLDAEGNRITDNIITSAQNMGQLIDDLIQFSQMARKELKQQTIDMEELVRQCAEELLQREQPGKYTIHTGTMPACRGDKALIKQVWLNLIGNAIKYTSKKDAPLIEIGYREAGPASCYFIRDNGAGFDMQYADKLFGVFQRLHDQSEFEGLGIGLSLVKRIINRHNGDIHAESVVGEGASFYFSLPEITVTEERFNA